MRLKDAGAGLIWCPSSNLTLFGKTAQITELARHGCLALGTDSRLSGARDLLDELRIAGEVGGLDAQALERLATSNSARLLRLPDRGVLRVGARADILILPAQRGLGSASRSDVRLVLIRGIVRYGDRDIAHCAEPASQWADIRVDGRSKILDTRIAALLRRAGAREPGLELQNLAWRAA
jgi:cytosine/adenosine deaminase-related metal-dependent hydrolase